ncbi:MAG: hypothetical protein KZQ82_15275, partial [Candidatus Thiodiazotropha sp. (ex Lucinoma annulata)]|nr:hypothetical protein [Candidatus Thiodiazotropha sp. (ex Lucinoma annulata)]
PGGVTITMSDTGEGQSSNGGGGAFSLWLLLILGLFTPLFQSVRCCHKRVRLSRLKIIMK